MSSIWIARDNDSRLHVYFAEPTWEPDLGMFVADKGKFEQIDPTACPQIDRGQCVRFDTVAPSDAPSSTLYRLCWRNVYTGTEGHGEWKAHLNPRETQFEREQYVDDREYWVETKDGAEC